jgi:hypothetical protein
VTAEETHCGALHGVTGWEPERPREGTQTSIGVFGRKREPAEPAGCAGSSAERKAARSPIGRSAHPVDRRPASRAALENLADDRTQFGIGAPAVPATVAEAAPKAPFSKVPGLPVTLARIFCWRALRLAACLGRDRLALGAVDRTAPGGE